MLEYQWVKIFQNVSLVAGQYLTEDMLIEIKAPLFTIAIVQVYVPTSESDSEDIDHRYEDLDKPTKQC